MRAPGLLTLEVATPPEFKGHAGIWSPEHLYVASVNACFMSTFLAIAELSKLEFVSFTCQAEGKLEKEEGRGYRMTEITLKPTLTVGYDHDRERATRILEKAEKNCLISNSINTAVRLEPEIVYLEAVEPVLA